MAGAVLTARQRFVELALARLGSVVLWGAKGPRAFDCSGLVTVCLHLAGGKDLTETHNSQSLADDTANLLTAPGAEPLPGDLVFYGADAEHISHVAIWLAGGMVLSADGATHRILDMDGARANPHNRVRLHDSPAFRPDLPYRAIHRFVHLDRLDKVSR